jgi:penicillin-binding protein 2
MKEKLKDRFTILTIAFVMIAVIILARLSYLQVTMGEYYDEQSQSRLLSQRNIAAPRGNIVDRFGVPLAVNRMGFTVQIIQTKTSVPDLNRMLLGLVLIFEKNGDTYNKEFTKYIKFGPINFGRNIARANDKIGMLKTYTGYRFKDVSSDASALDIFNYFRRTFKIGDEYTMEEAYKIMSMRFEILPYSTVNAVVLAKDVSKTTVAEIEEKHQYFPGVATDIIPIRNYINGKEVAHVLGYVGAINDKELGKRKDDGYRMNDIIGKQGVELAAEGYLKGIDGKKSIEVDTEGRFTEELKQDPAIPGNEVILTLDMRLQKVAMESLEKNIEEIRKKKDGKKNFGDAFSGAVVAMDVNTGEVLAMANYPSYDPSIFLAGADNKEAQKTITELLTDDVNKPMRNRAIQDIYAPGSTFKMLTAIAGLEEGVITPKSVIRDTGTEMIGGWKFTCLEYKMGYPAHGDLSLERALATSCNIYFHKLGAYTTIDKLAKWGTLFGLGRKTGIDVDSNMEEAGWMSSRETKKILHKEDQSWYPANTAMAAIGQFDNLFTPLQLCNYVSGIANGGKKYKPYLIKKVVKYDGSVVKEAEPEYEQLPVKKENLEAIKKGMVAVAATVEGTAAQAFKDFPYTVAGKTGTAETGGEAKNSSNALFVCFAPADKPQIAVAVVVERGAWGSNTAPIARDVLEEYFKVNKINAVSDRVQGDQAELAR